jgi:hypothetical protein
LTTTADAGKSFIDAFDDGSHVDDSPVTWVPYASPLDKGRLAPIPPWFGDAVFARTTRALT